MEHWGNSGQFPLPTFSTFILTNSFGTKVCLLCVCCIHWCDLAMKMLDVRISCDIL